MTWEDDDFFWNQNWCWLKVWIVLEDVVRFLRLVKSELDSLAV